jgi:hypothetical protein
MRFLFSETRRIVALAASHTLPAIYGFREAVVIGGLMSYGTGLNDLYRRAAAYVDKILKAPTRVICRSSSDQIQSRGQSQNSGGDRSHNPANVPVGRRRRSSNNCGSSDLPGGPVSDRSGGSMVRSRTTLLGHEERFPAASPNGRCRIRKRSVAIDDWRCRLLSQALSTG